MSERETIEIGDVSIDQVRALLDAKIQGVLEQGRARAEGATAEVAEVEGWWNLWAYGPFQVTSVGGPLLPHRVIREGETFYVATVLWLNDSLVLPGGVTACQLISNLGCGFVVDYCSGDLCSWAPAAGYSPHGIKVDLRAGQCYYVDLQRFVARQAGLFEMNIVARITGCQPDARPPLAGFATAVYDFDADMFYPSYGPTPGSPGGWKFDIPIRFQVYR